MSRREVMKALAEIEACRSSEDAEAKRIALVKKILKSHGIAMNIGGCGCCGSPWVDMVYRDMQIVWDSSMGSYIRSLTMIEDKES